MRTIENEPKNIQEILYYIITNFDKSFRIMAPGLIILLLFFWECDLGSALIRISKINIIFLLLVIPLLGMSYYSIHRTIFSLIDFLAINNDGKTLMEANILAFSNKHYNPLERTFIIFNATVHLAAMCCELIIIFYFIKKTLIPNFIYYICLVSFFIIIRIKIWITKLDYNIKKRNLLNLL